MIARHVRLVNSLLIKLQLCVAAVSQVDSLKTLVPASVVHVALVHTPQALPLSVQIVPLVNTLLLMLVLLARTVPLANMLLMIKNLAPIVPLESILLQALLK
jgi:hypothetical protein